MIYFKTVTLPASMPLHKRISEAAKQIREWVHACQAAFNHSRDQLRLMRITKENGRYQYRYEFMIKDSPTAGEENGADRETGIF
jgi:hypothetical protein